MSAFVTGGTGFIGKRLVRRLLERDSEPVYVLVYKPTPELIAALKEFWGAGAERVTLIEGDISKPDLGVSAKDARKLKGKIDHFFHLAAVYDLNRRAGAGGRPPTSPASPTRSPSPRRSRRAASITSARSRRPASTTACSARTCSRRRAGSSIRITPRSTRARAWCGRRRRSPWRIYRPGIVVGNSRTGEIDKIDGPYYFFKLIQKLRDAVPSWVPMIGIEGGRINVVPVDFVVAAMDHLAHLDGLDGRTFHLTDPNPLRVGDMLNALARAAHAPAFTVRVNAGLFGLAPPALTRGLMALTPFRRMRKMMMKELGLPDDVFMFVNYPTRFDSRETQKLLRPAGITVPPSRTTPGGSGTIGSAISIRPCSSTGRCAARSRASAFW